MLSLTKPEVAETSPSEVEAAEEMPSAAEEKVAPEKAVAAKKVAKVSAVGLTLSLSLPQLCLTLSLP